MGSGASVPDDGAPTPPASDALGYKSASALHDAINSRRKVAAQDGPYDINELRRQFACDRPLTRVFEHAPDRRCSRVGPVSWHGSHRTPVTRKTLTCTTWRTRSPPPLTSATQLLSALVTTSRSILKRLEISSASIPVPEPRSSRTSETPDEATSRSKRSWPRT